MTRAIAAAAMGRNGGPHDSGVSARGGRLRTCEVGRTRAGLGLVAAVERGIPVLSCQSPADGSNRAPSHGGRRRSAGKPTATSIMRRPSAGTIPSACGEPRGSSLWRLRPSRPWIWRRAWRGSTISRPSPGPLFRLGVVVAIVGATAFLIWLARVMTERGIRDGLLVLLAAPFVAHLPNDVAYGVEIVRRGLAPVRGRRRRWPPWLLRPSRFSALRPGRPAKAAVLTFGPRCWERSSSRR